MIHNKNIKESAVKGYDSTIDLLPDIKLIIIDGRLSYKVNPN